MKLPNKIREFLHGIQDYIESEKELLRLKLIKKASSIAGSLFSAIFILILFHITIAFIGIWLGFWLSDVFNSLPLGFGATAIFYILWLVVSIIFRKALLVKPVVNIVVAALTEEDKLPDDKP